ncbi:hypothetical protein RSAG8_01805, partial [Rhizoctonia solani AG-8 WAC10335]
MWSPDGKKLATRTRKAVRIWSSKDGSLLGTIQASNNNCTIEAIAWTSSSIESSNDQSNGESNEGDDTYDERENKEGNDTTNADEIKTSPGNKVKIESEKGKKGEPQLLVVEHVYKADQKMAGSTAILRYRHDTNNINNPWSSTSSKIIDHTSVISIGVVDDYRLVAVGVDTGGDPKSETEKFIRCTLRGTLNRSRRYIASLTRFFARKIYTLYVARHSQSIKAIYSITDTILR